MKEVNKNKLTNDLKHLEYLYRKSTSKKEKAFIASDYIHLANLMFDFYGEFDVRSLFVDRDSFARHISNVDDRTKEEYFDNIEFNGDLASKVLDVYSDNNYNPLFLKGDGSVNTKEFNSVLEGFFESLGHGVLNIYKGMIKNERIFVSNGLQEGFSGFCSMNLVDNTPTINILKSKGSYMYSTLAHEMGHAWNSQMYKNRGIYISYNIFTELPSTLFQCMFTEYLFKNHYIKNAAFLEEEHIMNNLYFAVEVDAINKSNQLDMLFDNDGFKVLGIDNFERNETYDSIYEKVGTGTGMFNELQDELVEYSITSATYFLGELISTDLINKYDAETIMDFISEFMINVPYKNFQVMIEKYDLFKNFNGFEKTLKRSISNTKKRYNFK